MAKVTDSEKIKVIQKAREIIKNSPNGIRTGQLSRELKNQFPEIPDIYYLIYKLNEQFPEEIIKPTKGLLIHVNNRNLLETKVDTLKKTMDEKIFYGPFANWLTEDLEECTKAFPWGNSRAGYKWGTPDVVGIYTAPRSWVLKPSDEIITAEVKAATDWSSLITAFGQACSYKLFSHKTYMVISKPTVTDYLEKIDALCLLFGIGLVVFDPSDIKNVKFEIRTRAYKHEPDMFYVNDFLNQKEIKKLFFEEKD